MATESHPRASLGVKKKDAPGVAQRAQTMHDTLTLNAGLFPGIPITMVAFLALLTALILSQSTVKGTKATGSAQVRNAKRNALWSAMGSILMYVQGLADTMDAANASALILSAGLVVAATQKRHKAILAAALTATPGTVHLEANATAILGPSALHKKVTWNWQWSSNGGQTWTDLHSTPFASTDVPGLAMMTTHSFRVSVTIGRVTQSWSQVTSLLVH
jgi:hypothetical protein